MKKKKPQQHKRKRKNKLFYRESPSGRLAVIISRQQSVIQQEHFTSSSSSASSFSVLWRKMTSSLSLSQFLIFFRVFFFRCLSRSNKNGVMRSFSASFLQANERTNGKKGKKKAVKTKKEPSSPLYLCVLYTRAKDAKRERRKWKFPSSISRWIVPHLVKRH